MKEARHKSSLTAGFLLYEASRIEQSVETESRPVVARAGWGNGGDRCGYGVSFGGGENVPSVVVGIQLREVYFKNI